MRGPLIGTVSAAALVGALMGALPAQADSSRTEALPAPAVIAVCESLWDGVYDTPNAEPLGPCQWDMALINADDETRAHEAGSGVRVGVIDSGVDPTHPDIAANLDLDSSCSFINSDDPAIMAGLSPAWEASDGDCDNKAAVEDASGHGTHVASTIAAPVNGIGIAGVAPEATIVALKACTEVGYCFGDAVAAALRAAGDLQLDVVNLSLYADPYLYYCGNDAGERAMAREIQEAARYAQQRGVLIVAAHGNQADDLQHPTTDGSSPNGPDDTPIERTLNNQCRVLPTELPGVVGVSATGPVGVPGYTMNIAGYSSVGAVDVTAPGGDYFRATGTVQDAILAAVPADSAIFAGYDPLNAFYPGITVIDNGATYAYLNGTSMASPHAAGVAALIVGQHPRWSQSAVRAALVRTATPMSCPADWEPLNAGDDRERCYGGSDGWTSFFGHGLVDAARASGL